MNISFEVETLSLAESALHELACLRARTYLQSEASLLETIMEVDRTRLYLKFGLRSSFSYCVEQLGLTEAVTANFINVARKSQEVPELKLAIEAGHFSVSKARKIVPVLTSENQQEWITKASEMTQSKLEREVAEELPAVPKPERARPVKNHMVRLEIELPEELMRKLRRLQDLESESEGKCVDLLETLTQMIEDRLERIDPVEKAKRNVSRDMLKSKSIPAQVKHAVNLRDQRKCQARKPDGTKCEVQRFTHLHHIKPKCEGGPDTVDNLITLCSHCHRRWHEMHARPS